MAEGADARARPIDPLRGSYRLIRRWRRSLIAEIDQPAVIEKLRNESGTTRRYIFMTCMSAGIAILGMLLSSPAVVIGAMLLSPLMGPILGIGFALATGDFQWMRTAARALAIGIVLAIAFCALIVLVSPLKTITEEIAARTRPNLFDLGIALFSALAGAYAMIRGREGTIVGVAIATALMPPLAAIGFGLATVNWTVFGGALFLFFTNLMTIALTAAAMARLYGFWTHLTPRGTLMQTLAMVGVFVMLAIPLGLTLRQIAWETNATRTANSVLADEFADDARVSQLDLDFDSKPIGLTASVLTPEIIDDAEERVKRTLAQQLNRPIHVEITQYRVGTAGDAATAELALARMRQQEQAVEQATGDLTERLVLVAGVRASAVTIDREAHRAIVRARPLPDAGLETYRVLEQRVAATESDWTIELVPPAGPLPVIAVTRDPADGEGQDGEEASLRPTEDGAGGLALAVWAASRIGAPIEASGRSEAAEAVAALLRARGVDAVAHSDRTAPADRVTLNWLAPDEAGRNEAE